MKSLGGFGCSIRRFTLRRLKKWSLAANGSGPIDASAKKRPSSRWGRSLRRASGNRDFLFSDRQPQDLLIRIASQKIYRAGIHTRHTPGTASSSGSGDTADAQAGHGKRRAPGYRAAARAASGSSGSGVLLDDLDSDGSHDAQGCRDTVDGRMAAGAAIPLSEPERPVQTTPPSLPMPMQ